MRRVSARLASAVLAVLVGGGLGAFGLTPASAGAAVPVATKVVTKAAAASCATGKYQKQVEGYLKKLGGYGTVTVDGKQSAADCAAIVKFQKRFGIQPAKGLAGPTTFNVAKRLASTKTSACKAKKKGITFCVDLTNQTTYVMKNGKVLVKPTVTRTGMKNYRTPAGTFKINKRTKKEWSDPYEVWLPYWQRFIGGRGFHQTTTYIHDMWRGSHGCVNLLPQDAKKYYSLGKIGSTVKVYGRRSGT
ncbi:lipoprotein-anchoring transpeptidase ErfK/SrfK [Actinoplanes lutulentus]|uniref:L,D-transpeptidase family protein n=1 Tax=Actinoplanes lutulentus TaxID=1287878 RepID=UPI001837B2CB|nr:L,D-transpeptidase family protein [Actinoplanes lutulentus]MBB2943869.1 lipoprotein-anchoring transpeptidase ErfK/SrfK [Actinoplanes lutulentus]